MKYRIISLLVSFGILALLIYLSDWGGVLHSIGKTDLVYISLGIILSLFLMLLRTFRWKFLLNRVQIFLPLSSIFYTFMAGLFISNITPARIGEPVRSYILKRRDGISFSRSLPSVLVERILDIIALIMLAVLGAFILFHTLDYYFQSATFLVILVYIVLISAIVFICSRRDYVLRFSNLLYKLLGWVPSFRRIELQIESMALNFHKSLLTYKDRDTLLSTLLLSLIIWSFEGLILQVSFRSLAMSPDLLPSIGILSIAMLIAIISSLPGGIGSQEAVMVLLFTSSFDFPIQLTTAAVLIYRVISLWLNLLVGGICFATKS
jgi:uncharacterized protein (TIRG00374 family)